MRLSRLLASIGATAIVASGLAVLPAAPALALQGTVPGNAATSWQTNGQVRALAYANGRVYLGGDFTSVRPPGAAPGTGEVARSRIAAFDATTGALVTSFNPGASASVHALTASPDGKTVYVGGDFGTIGGATRNRVAAFATETGALTGFAPRANARVSAIAATASTVYLGGSFSTLNSIASTRLGAVSASTGAKLSAFAASADNVTYHMALSKQGDRLYLAGAFTAVNGSTGAYAAASLDPTTGALQDFPAASVIPPRTPGCIVEMRSVKTDDTGVYYGSEGTGGGCFDGTFAANVSNNGLRWVSKCLGATQAVEVLGGVLYAGSHAHDCSGDMGFDPDAFPETGWSRGISKKLTARSAVDGKINAWMPNTDGGPNGVGLGPRVMSTDGTQLFVGGEFTTVNGQRQQGFVRFSPSTGGLAAPAQPARPVAVARAGGKVSVYVQAPVDIDDTDLTVRLYRNGGSTPIASKTVHSLFWRKSVLAFEDNGLPVGTSHTYTADAIEVNGPNASPKSPVSAAVTVSSTVGSYSTAVQEDDPLFHWRLGETAGPVAADASDGLAGGVYSGGITYGLSGGVGDTDRAIATNGSTGFIASAEKTTAPAAYSVEAWFKTTSTSGGKIIGFGDRQGGLDFGGNPALSSSYDKHVYMTNDGRLVFGVWTGSASTLTTSAATPLNDGQWHHVVGTQGANGMALYVDGVRVGQNGETKNQQYEGHWRVGGDNLGFWPDQPASNFFAGTIDDVAVYKTALTRNQVVDHFAASGRTAPVVATPADSYGKAVYADSPLSYWRMDDPAGSGTAADASGNGGAATVVGGVTLGADGALGSTGKAAALDGSDANVVSPGPVSSPGTFSVELFFRTTSTTGGKIIGFGNVATGTSGSYDKHVYMTNDGRLVFGTYTTGVHTATTALTYNDGTWHHLVATQGASGMALYVDGALVGTNSQPANQPFDGYWRVGGDNLGGWPDQPSSPYFAGSVDEVAIYGGALSAARVGAHYAASGGTAPDTTAPTTVITSPANGSSVGAGTVDVTATATDDVAVTTVDLQVDGAVVATDTTAPYAFTWSAAAGPHTLRTVARDAAGNSGTSSDVTVTVVAPDTTAPTAPSTLTASGVSASQATLTWSAATDANGVTGYEVVRGGSVITTVTGTTTSYTDTTLSAGATYEYTVRARDAAGNVSPDSPSASVTTPAAPPADVLFSDTWSAADGAPWSSSWATSVGTGTADTAAGAGRLAVQDTANAYARAQLTAVPARTDSEVAFSYRWSSNTAVSYFGAYLRGSGGWQNAYRPRNGYGVQVQSNSGTVSVLKNVNGVVTTLGSVTGGQQVTTNKQNVRLRVNGSQIQVWTWADGSTEPVNPTYSTSDTGVTAGGQLFLSHVRGGTNTGTRAVAVDDLTLRSITP